MRPEWKILSKSFPIGQAVTWHKALNLLVEKEKLVDFNIKIYAKQYITISSEGNQYIIIKRG